jgi:stage V sporulation protein R
LAPRLQPWQREILRIVRHLAQYFYPQQQTKVMNEGCATFVHYKVVEQLYDSGQLSEGAMLEILDSHTAVVRQLDFDHPHYSGINPYWLGFGMMSDIMRISTEPTDEDRAWFPAIAGNGDPWGTLREVWRDYRDESFVLQFLSPHLMRKMKLFRLHDDSGESELSVDAIHDERGYRDVREALARTYDIGLQEPDIQVVDVDLVGDRRLVLHHRQRNGISLEPDDARRVLRHIANLWGYPVRLVEVDAATDRTTREYEDIEPRDPFV